MVTHNKLSGQLKNGYLLEEWILYTSSMAAVISILELFLSDKNFSRTCRGNWHPYKKGKRSKTPDTIQFVPLSIISATKFSKSPESLKSLPQTNHKLVQMWIYYKIWIYYKYREEYLVIKNTMILWNAYPVVKKSLKGNCTYNDAPNKKIIQK